MPVPNKRCRSERYGLDVIDMLFDLHHVHHRVWQAVRSPSCTPSRLAGCSISIMYTIAFGRLFGLHHVHRRVWLAVRRASAPVSCWRSPVRRFVPGCLGGCISPIKCTSPLAPAYWSRRRRSRLAGCFLPIRSTVAFGQQIQGCRASVARTSGDGRVARSAPGRCGQPNGRWRRADAKRSLLASPKSCSAS